MWFTMLSAISLILVAGCVSYSMVQSRVIENAQDQVFSLPAEELEVEDFTPETKPNNASDVNEEVCKQGFVDAATRTKDGSTYLFRGDYYWKIDGGIVYGYPRLIAEDWKGVGSGPIDAAFTWNDGSTFIFKGDSYWRFYNLQPEKGYPRKIQDGFRGIPNNVDAALVWQNNGMTYFFKGSKYWRYAQKQDNPTTGDYPADISAWKGVPNDVSAAIRWVDGLTYFFKGTNYIKYDNINEIVPRDYPVPTGKAWFECDKGFVKPEDKLKLERENPIRNPHEKIMTRSDEYIPANQTLVDSSTNKLNIDYDDKMKLKKANEEVCQHGLVDAATRTKDGNTYLFRGDYYWKIDGGIVYGYPRLIAEDWKGVGSGPIDAAFTWNDGSTFIFKGDSYWRFYNLRPEKGYPRKIQDGFRGIPNNVDAALVWQNNGMTYFFKGSKYWRYDPKEANPTTGDYPADISSWNGVPNDVSAAIRWVDGLTYFFKGTIYYKFENDAERVKNAPAETGRAWFECEKVGIRTDNKSMFEREISNRNQHEEVMTKIEELKSQVDLVANASKDSPPFHPKTVSPIPISPKLISPKIFSPQTKTLHAINFPYNILSIISAHISLYI